MNSTAVLILAGVGAVGCFEIGRAAAEHVRLSQAGVRSMPEKWQFEGAGDYLVAVAAGAGAIVYAAMAAKPMLESWAAALAPR